MLAQATTRKTISPPSGFEGHLCRRDAAALLGFASEFKVRQLEKEGRLHPVRGAMGSAWYPRREVEALRATSVRPSSATAAGLRWPDDALIALLREKPRTVVDLVVDAGISISRAERVYRFWLTHEGAAPAPVAAPVKEAPVKDAPVNAAPAKEAPVNAAPAKEAPANKASERRGDDRLARDALVRQLRDADPKIRSAAFEQLKSLRR